MSAETKALTTYVGRLNGTHIEPVSDALGSEVVRLGLSRPIDDAIFAFVHRAFIHHLVLVFREQTLSPESRIAFSRGLVSIDI